jgi:hypothetical protein
MKQNFTVRNGALSGVEAFLSVAERRSFRRAAAELGVTPSAIGQSVRALEHGRDHRAPRLETQQPGRPLPKVARDLACGNELLEGGLCPGKESRCSLREPDAPRRSGEQRRADARLEALGQFLIK